MVPGLRDLQCTVNEVLHPGRAPLVVLSVRLYRFPAVPNIQMRSRQWPVGVLLKVVNLALQSGADCDEMPYAFHIAVDKRRTPSEAQESVGVYALYCESIAGDSSNESLTPET
jgi:hypothetical protein